MRQLNSLGHSADSTNAALPTVGSLIVLQREHITEVLNRENGNKSKAAKVLGIERRKLYRMMEKHGLTVNHVTSVEDALDLLVKARDEGRAPAG